MSKHVSRRRKHKLIRAAASNKPIHGDASPVEWIKAEAEESTDKPKRFSMTAYTGGPMHVGYGAPVIVDLAGVSANESLPILLDHDTDRIVGHADNVAIEERTIKLSGVISGVGDAATEVLATAKNGFPWRASIGATPDKMEFVGEDVATTVNGKTHKGPLYVARRSTLREVSFVAIPADSRTSAKVAARAAKHKESAMDEKLRQFVLEFHLDPETLTEEQIAGFQAAYDAKSAATPPVKATATKPDPIDAEDAELLYEQHLKAVRATHDRYRMRIESPKLDALAKDAVSRAIDCKLKAMEAGWDQERLDREFRRLKTVAEVEAMRSERPAGPAIHASSYETTPVVLEASFARSCGVNVEKHYKPEVLEASDRLGSIGLQELLLRAAHAGGGVGHRMKIDAGNLREALTAAYPGVRAGFSGIDVSGILSAVANKSLLDGFYAIPQAWREVAAIRSVSDFKAATAYRLTASLEYEELPPTGAIKHGSLGEDSYSYSAKTYAKLLAISRPDIINDDLGAFNDIRTRLGIGGAVKMNRVFWTAWLAGIAANFWVAGSSNLSTGSGLGDSGIAKAVGVFRTMMGPDGNMMNLEPAKLLCPPELEAIARKFYVSTELRDTTANTRLAVANIYQGRFKPVVVPELSSTAYTGHSATNWWLLADPGVLASAVMCFLNGVETPTIEAADADFDTLGIQFRGYHDFGVALSEPYASVLCTVA